MYNVHMYTTGGGGGVSQTYTAEYGRSYGNAGYVASPQIECGRFTTSYAGSSGGYDQFTSTHPLSTASHPPPSVSPSTASHSAAVSAQPPEGNLASTGTGTMRWWPV